MDGREKLANTCVHVDPHGELKAVYRKLHMFDVQVAGRVYRESDLEDAGEEIVLSQSAGGVELGLSICYDLRFPELYRILAVRGALVFPLPAAFTLATTRDHWETLLRARAIENQAFVIAANQIGEHPGGSRSGGRSMIVDPWGIVLAQAPDAPGPHRRRARPGAPGADPRAAAVAGQPPRRCLPLARGAARMSAGGAPAGDAGVARAPRVRRAVAASPRRTSAG